MALSGTTTYTRLARFAAPEGGKRVIITLVTPGGSSTYTASGEPITAANLGMTKLEAVIPVGQTHNASFDVASGGASGLLRLFTAATTPGPAVKLVEFTGGTAIATTDLFYLIAIGV